MNFMAGNLTSQVRAGIARVVTAVANGDLNRKLTVEAKGEIAELTETINEMIDTLATFADQVTTVAREVGVEGEARRSGEGARRRRHLARADRERQPTRGQPDDAGAGHRRGRHGRDPRRPDAFDHRRAQGEVASLSYTINEMIRNLRDDPEEHRAGLAQDEPGEVQPHAAGPARPRTHVGP